MTAPLSKLAVIGKECLCGKAAIRYKSGTWVCGRCDEIERQRKIENTIEGMKRARDLKLAGEVS